MALIACKDVKKRDFILSIVTDDEHIQQIQDDVTGRHIHKNQILDMIKNELKLDHYY